MANRYLRGTGARNWNDTNNWSETSGGAGGASVPTSADSVIFDANSGTGTITVNATANMLDFTCTNIGALTLANSAYAFNVFGSLTLHSNLTVSFTSTGYLYLKATTTGKNITSNGNTQGWNRIYFDGVGGEWNNQDDWNMSAGDIQPTNGTWNTNGKTIRCTTFRIQAGTITINFSNSNIYISGGFSCYSSTNLTLNAGTSTIYNSGQYHNSKASGAITLYDVVLSYSSAMDSITGNFIFNNLTRIGGNNISSSLLFSANQTINGALTITGNNAQNNRLLIASNTLGTARTITVNGSIAASNVDFRDITLAGTANRDLSTITGGSGDCGGNSGITFTPAINCYFKHTSGAVNWSDVTKWVTTDGGSTQARVPLPQDTAMFTANSFAGASTVSLNVPRIGGLNMEGVNQAVTLTATSYEYKEVYKDFILGSSVTTSIDVFIYYKFLGRGEYFVNTYNVHTALLEFITSGIYRIISDTKVSVFITASGTGSLYMGNGTHINYCRAANQIIYINISNFYAENSTFVFSKSNTVVTLANFNGNNKTFNKLVFGGSYTGYYALTGSNIIDHLAVEKGKTLCITGGSSQTVAKTSIQGTPAEPVVLTSTNTTPFNLVHSGSGYHQWDYVNVSYCNATANRFYAGERSTNGGNNTGLLFRNYLLRDNMILKRFIKPINFRP